jgi:hypothetical protein
LSPPPALSQRGKGVKGYLYVIQLTFRIFKLIASLKPYSMKFYEEERRKREREKENCYKKFKKINL